MVTALGRIGRDSIAGLLNGLKSGDADIQNAAKFLGNNLIASFKTVLGIASPSREFKKIGESAGEGFEQGLLKSIEIAEQSATRKMQRMLDRLARMALMMSGMSGPEIGRQVAQARALPSLNFGATTPRSPVSIGPSSTGRALPPGASRPELPGTAFGRQKYLPTALGEELKEVLRGAANAFLDSIRQNIRAVTVTDMGAPPSRQGLLQGGSVAGFLPGRASATSVLELNNILAGAIREYFKSVAREIEYRSGSIGKTPLSTTPLLAQSRVAGLLPQSVGRTPSAYRSGPRESQEQLFARRTREAYINSSARAANISQSPLALPPGVGLGQPSMMRAPSVPPSMGGGGAPPVPPSGGGGGGSFGGMRFNVPQLPGAGVVREIGTEFAFAAKQVLLFGTAYKALAFLQGFPSQVGNAVGALQSFRNTLGAISPSAAEAAASSQFILDIVDKYNTPIQSARDGFTKLYASMKPTGFSGDEIRDLFLGISQAAATFGMSAEKVDRVNYAFAQMASKGQVMSEELKGQLGDVLPGAMGIFAEAAGFTGPEAITKFSKALEDGAYKGAAMKTLLTNVGAIMRKEFGPGAEGAARTFQGVINRMQNSFKALYESFEPVAVGFLNSVVMPMTGGLKTITDGLNAFFTGAAAKTSGGFAIAQELEKLKPTFDGLRENAGQVIQVFGQFAQAALGVGKVLLQIASNPFIGYIARVYLNVLVLTTAINVLNLRALIPFLANLARSAFALIAFSVQMIRAKQTTQLFGLMVQTAGITLRTFFATTGIGLVLVGIGLLTERFMSMNQALADTKAKALGAAQAIRSMTKTEAILDERKTVSAIKLLETLQTRKRSYEGSTDVSLTKSEASLLEDVGVPVNKGGFGGGQYMNPTMLESQKQRLETVNLAELRNRQRVIKNDENEAKQTAAITPITELAGDGTAAGKGKGADKLDTYNRSTLDFIKLRLEAEKQSLDQRRQAGLLSETGYKIAVAELELESSKEEIAERLRLSRIAINQDNLSAADKALKLKDTEIIAEGELSIAANKRNIAVEGARKELEGPFNEAIDSANFSIMEQQMLLENIRNGIQGLTPDQQAYLQVLRLTTGKNEDELKLLVAKSNVTRQILEQDIAIKKQVDFEQKLRGLREEIKLLLIVNDAESRLAELRNEYDGDAAKAQQIFNLEEVKRNIEATRALIDDFVSSTTSDYKGFLKAVISGEDAADALKQLQASLKDKVLTIFLDFAMAPIEKSLKEGLFSFFKPKVDPKLLEQEKSVNALAENTAATRANTDAIKGLQGGAAGAAQALPVIPFGESADAAAQSMSTISDAFSSGLSAVNTSAQGWNQALNFGLPSVINTSAQQIGQQGGVLGNSLGSVTGVIGAAASSIMGIVAGVSQMGSGGTSGVLGGIGSIFMGLGGALGGIGGMFGGGLSSAFSGGASSAIGTGASGWSTAFATPLRFANGGMVTGPTLGLVGEGKYNEAIVPLPDGRSIPVQMKGASGGGLREAMSGNNGKASGSPILNMSFQSTNINGVEYVSRDQLEAAMATTRKQAAKDGANRGMSMTLDKLQQSPQTRNRLGMR